MALLDLLGSGEDCSDLDELSAHKILQLVYRGKLEVTPMQMRALGIAIGFESPKLTATAMSSMDGKDFASLLEKAIARSSAPLVIEHQPSDRELPPSAPPGIRGRSGNGQ
jgi:hypothetical protein